MSLSVKDWWVVVSAQLRPITNDNTLSPSLASLVSSLLAGYPVNVGHIIATEIWDKALNERSRWTEAHRISVASKFKDFENHLFGAKSASVGPPALVPHISVEIPQVEGSSEQGATSQPDAVTIPPLVVPESLISLFSEPPTTQLLDDFWGELSKDKSSKRKQKARESNEEKPTNLSKDERRQHKKSRKESQKLAREAEALAQQRQDVGLASASSIVVPTPVSGSQPDLV
uniref:Integrase core domain containing protein n=1 Tax=Solanum tuberosum TaxID=4113 RepID=M1DH93_SOLTU